MARLEVTDPELVDLVLTYLKKNRQKAVRDELDKIKCWKWC